MHQVLRGSGGGLRVTQRGLQLVPARPALQPGALRLRALLRRPQRGASGCQEALQSMPTSWQDTVSMGVVIVLSSHEWQKAVGGFPEMLFPLEGKRR